MEDCYADWCGVHDSVCFLHPDCREKKSIIQEERQEKSRSGKELRDFLYMQAGSSELFLSPGTEAGRITELWQRQRESNPTRCLPLQKYNTSQHRLFRFSYHKQDIYGRDKPH